MTIHEAKMLRIGLYRLHWKHDAGFSLASVGMLHSGRRWFAPCNWTSVSEAGVACTKWRMVERAEFVEPQ